VGFDLQGSLFHLGALEEQLTAFPRNRFYSEVALTTSLRSLHGILERIRYYNFFMIAILLIREPLLRMEHMDFGSCEWLVGYGSGTTKAVCDIRAAHTQG
jgi:hypothetical protein